MVMENCLDEQQRTNLIELLKLIHEIDIHKEVHYHTSLHPINDNREAATKTDG